MRSHASVLHLDLDAFFASVEQRDKPSLRGKPVIVGGIGPRGVVATASYEARRYGVRSAMSTREARARCPHAAFLNGRFHAYRAASDVVMGLLRSYSPLVEPLSLDEAFVDLEHVALEHLPSLEVDDVRAFAERLRAEVEETTGGLTASVGLGTSKFVAKVASDLDKPHGLVLVPPGTERDLLRPMQVSVIPGVGPASAERLARADLRTVADVESVSEAELVRILGRAHGSSLYRLARAIDDRPVVPDREAKSVSVEGTYERDLTDRRVMDSLLTTQARDVARRLQRSGISGRTVTIKVRLYDFTTLSRSSTLTEPTDSPSTIARIARTLLADLDTSGGVRLLGVGVSGLADWVQEGLFGDQSDDTDDTGSPDSPDSPDDTTDDVTPEPDPDVLRAIAGPRQRAAWAAGQDVVHAELGRGWVWGAGRGVVTVRFETAETPSGPVRSFSIDDPALTAWTPAPAPAPEPEPATGPENQVPSEPPTN